MAEYHKDGYNDTRPAFLRHGDLPSGFKQLVVRQDIPPSNSDDRTLCPQDDLSEVEWKSHRSHRITNYVRDVSRSSDLTIHLELTLVDDLGPDMDEFLRLTRLGHFNAAKDFFHKNLEQHAGHPYVFVLYAQMLLNSADYAAITALKNRVPSGLKGDRVSILQDCWRLIKLVTRFHDTGVLDDDAQAKSIIDTAIFAIRQADQYGSTEIRVLSLIFVAVAQFLPYATFRDRQIISQYTWNRIYQQLLDQGRVWDFRDLFTASVNYIRPDKLLLDFYAPRLEHASLFDILVEDWSCDIFDESTSLALLDVMVAMYPISAMDPPDSFLPVHQWLEHTENIASLIAKTDADLLMTRSYLRWSLAKLRLSTARGPSEATNPSPYPGQIIFDDVPHFLPVYAPTGWEMADWASLALPSHANANIELILNAAKHLGDLDTHSLCCQMLIIHSKDPLVHVKGLTDLQRTTQHDIHGLLNTLLFKYMLCKDTDSRKHLRSEIMYIEHGDNFEKPLRWALYMVLRALSDTDRSQSWLDMAKSLYKDLPTFIQEHIKEETHDVGRQERKEDSKYPKKGKTRIPSHLVRKKAIIELGYPFVEEENSFKILKALGEENIDELLRLSEYYKETDQDGLEVIKVDVDPETRTLDDNSSATSSSESDSSHMGPWMGPVQTDENFILPSDQVPSHERQESIGTPSKEVETVDATVQTDESVPSKQLPHANNCIRRHSH